MAARGTDGAIMKLKKVKAATLSGQALSWAVASATGLKPVMRRAFLLAHDVTHDVALEDGPYLASGDESLHPLLRLSLLPDYPDSWDLLGPLLEEFELNVIKVGANLWTAKTSGWVVDGDGDTTIISADGPTPGVAIARCVVCVKLGYEVEVPEELLP